LKAISAAKDAAGFYATSRLVRRFSAILTIPLVFHFTPKHASWLNQIEIWFSILVRKLIRRGNFQSKSDLAGKIGDFINCFNETMAKPFRWIYQANLLTV